MTREAHLVLFLNPIGEHPAASALADRRYGGLGGLTRLAREAEDALFDAVFLADSPAAGGPGVAAPATADGSSVGAAPGDRPADAVEHGIDRERLIPKHEPITLLAAIAAQTSRIGLIATASTSFFEPYNLARLFASLDLISGGRAGWNAVTTSHPGAAANFGDAHWKNHARRYAVAEEFLQVVEGLWDERREAIGHDGAHFHVEGPLDIPPSTQGRPVISQAGGSTEGIGLGARHAEVVFAIQPSVPVAQRFVRDLRERADREGRDGAALRILPGVIPYLADTDDEAHAYRAELDARVDLDALYPLTARYLHVDEALLRSAPLHEPFPIGILPAPSAVDNSVGTFLHLVERITAERLTLAQSLIAAAGGRHREIVGTPETFADDLAEWLQADAGDGFVVMLPHIERDLPYFTEHVIPVLQRRGLFRRAYAGSTLRAHLDLEI